MSDSKSKTVQGAAAPKRRRPARYHHGNLKPVLLDVAGEMLEADGPAKLSLRAVARRASVSQTAPYNHFSDKNALLAALAAEGFRMLSASMTAAATRKKPADTASMIHALGRGYLDFALTNRERLNLMFGAHAPAMAAHPDLATDAQSAFAIISEAIGRFVAEGNRGPRGTMGPMTATIAAWSIVHGLAALLADGKVVPATTEAGTADALIDQVLDVVIDGLTAGPGDQ